MQQFPEKRSYLNTYPLLFLFLNKLFISAGISAAAAAAAAPPNIQAEPAKPAKVIFMSEDTPTKKMLVMLTPNTLSTNIFYLCNKAWGFYFEFPLL